MKKTLLFIFFSFVLFIPASVSAATLSLQATPTTVGIGKIVEITLLVTSAVPVNAFSGTLHFPKKLLSPISVSDGNSVVNMWITRPKITSGTITFAGVTPGGFSGKNGVLFKVLFKTKTLTPARLSLTGVHILRNDGSGTKENVVLVPIILKTTTKSTTGFKVPSDTLPPESFTTVLGHSSSLFKGKYYLAFSTVDKNSGIDHYEVAETRWPLWLVAPTWKRITSPYVLHDQNLTSDISIKAVDRSGNIRVSISPRRHLLRGDEWFALGGILLLLWAVLWRKH